MTSCILGEDINDLRPKAFKENYGTTIDIADIRGVTVPRTGRDPIKAIDDNYQYTGTVEWSDGNPASFTEGVSYTATITLTAKKGYTFKGVAADFFKVTGATSVNNNANSGIIKAKFPATLKNVIVDGYVVEGLGPVWYDGNSKAVDIQPIPGNTKGARTIYYQGTDSTTYDKNTTAPTDAGTYTVTFDVAATTDFSAQSGVFAGTLIIAPKPITISGVTAVDRTYYDSFTSVELNGGILPDVISSDSVTFTLGSGTIADADAGDNKPVTTNISLTGTRANNYTLTQPTNITVNISKANGAAISNAPTLAAKTHNSITISNVTAPYNGQPVEYAINTENSAPTTGWQDDTTFSGLNMGTTYYIFARSKGNTNYNAGAAGSSLSVATNPVISSNSIEYYWVDRHGSLVTTSGGAVNILSGSTLAITAEGSGYSNHKWYVNGVNTGQSGTTYNFTNTAAGTHTVSMVVEKDGVPYNTSISITVKSSYIVTFNINGGTGGTAPASQTVVFSHNSITLPDGSGFSKTGYAFEGWNTRADGEGTKYNTGDTYYPTGDITLYAMWYEGILVTTASDWNNVLTDIRNGGSGTFGAPKTYAINIDGNVSVSGSTSTSLGSVEYVEVTLVGSGTLSLSSNGSILTIGSNQKLIIDSEDLTLQGHSSNNRSLVYVNSYGELELKNGTISGNTYYSNITSYSDSYTYAGGVYVSSNGTFNMSGGKISGNISSSSSYYYTAYAYGGGVSNYGTFSMSGGEISDNRSSSTHTYSGYSYNSISYGGAVYNNGTFTMSGGTISGNTSSSSNSYSSSYAYAYGGGVYISSGSSFAKSGGGIIYGNNEGSNSNTAKANSSGHAVYWSSYSYSYYRSTTLGESNDISTNDSSSPPWNQ
jgi:uncharacterized repeat protein (TIGR02543 family)